MVRWRYIFGAQRMMEMIIFALLLARHGISGSFLFERRTSAVVVMGKLSSVMLVGIRIICAITIIWIVCAAGII